MATIQSKSFESLPVLHEQFDQKGIQELCEGAIQVAEKLATRRSRK